MTPSEALQLINGVTERINGTRADHQMIEEALNTLDKAIKDLEMAEALKPLTDKT